MSGPYAHLLNSDSRAVRAIDDDVPGGVLLPGGYLLGQWHGNIGDYHDIIYQKGYRGGDAAIPHYASGGTVMVSETDGVWWGQDKDHPIGALMKPDGSLSEEVFYYRPEGRTRVFFLNNTYKVCVNAVDVIGARTYEQLGYRFEVGPSEVQIPKGGILVVLDGSGADAHVVHAQSGDHAFTLSAGLHGMTVWKL